MKIADALEKLRAANEGKVNAKLQAGEVALLLGYIVSLEDMVEKASRAQLVHGNGFFNQSEPSELIEH